MDKKNIVSITEALLFASGIPLNVLQLKEILQVSETVIIEALDLYEKRLEDSCSGLQLQKIAGGYQLATKKELYPYVSKLGEVKEKNMSTAAMETLAIIAFKQPITKQEIENVRGVHVDRVITKLLAEDLICETGRKSVLGRPILYGTTDTFLACFGLENLEELKQHIKP